MVANRSKSLAKFSAKFLASTALVCLTFAVGSALAYETTTVTTSLSDTSATGTMSLAQDHLSEGYAGFTSGGYDYGIVYRYFTPSVSGTYAMGMIASPIDTAILLYSPSFSTSDPVTGFIDVDDDNNITDIADPSLQAYVSAYTASQSCGGLAAQCPLLVYNLVAGTTYYIVVGSWDPALSLGAPTDSVSFYVIGDALVAVGGEGNYVSVAAPTNAASMASYLDSHDGSGDLVTVATYLDGASEETVYDSLRSIFPVDASLAPQVMMGASSQTSRVLVDKIETVLGEVNVPQAVSFANGTFNTSAWIFGDASLADHAQENEGVSFSGDMTYAQSSSDVVTSLSSIPYKKFDAHGKAFWIQGVVGMTNGTEDGLSHGYDLTQAGVVSGYEVTLTPDSLLGVVGSVFRTDTDMDDNAGHTDATTYSLGLYGQHVMGDLKLTGVALASYSRYDTVRHVNVGGIGGNPESDYDGWGTSTTLTLSQLLEENAVKIEPFLSATVTTSTISDYQETGGGVYNMDVGSDTSVGAVVKTGVTWEYAESVYDIKIRPYVGYHWDIDPAENSVRLSGATDSVVIAGRDEESVLLGLAAELVINLDEANSLKVGADVSHDANDDGGLVYIGYGLKF